MVRSIFAVLLLTGITLSAGDHGPDKGTLVIVGGNMQDPAIVKRFIDLAGGPDAPIVIIPTAGEADDEYDQVLVRAETVARERRAEVDRPAHARSQGGGL